VGLVGWVDRWWNWLVGQSVGLIGSGIGWLPWSVSWVGRCWDWLVGQSVGLVGVGIGWLVGLINY